MIIEFTKWDKEFLENAYPEEKLEVENFDAEIALKYTTKKDGISGRYATKAKTLAYITPTMAKRIVGVENFLTTAKLAFVAGKWNSDIKNGLFVELKKVEK